MRLSPGRFLSLLGLGVVALNAFIAALSWFSLARSRAQYVEQAAVTAQNLAQVLEQNISGTISKVDVGVCALAREVERQLAAGGIRPKALEATLAAVEGTLPELDGLRFADARGDMVTGPRTPQRVPVNVADRDYFVQLRDQSLDRLVQSRPLRGRVDGQWIIALARRVNRPDGSFAGVAFGALPLKGIDRLFSSIRVGHYGAFALRDGQDLALVARFPEPEGIGSGVGHRRMSDEFMRLLGQGRLSGSYDGPSGLDRRMRTWSYRKFADGRFFIFVGLARDEYLADWRREARVVGFFQGFMLLASLATAAALFRAWRRSREAEDALRAHEEQLRNAEKLESLGSLAGGVAHDMNNVLGAILGIASANLESQPEGSRARKAFDTISRAAVRGGEMVRSLLTLARQTPAEERELDLNGILAEEVRLLERTTLAKVRLVMDLAPDLRPILGDPSALSHAIMNLCVNAVDAMPEQGTLSIRSRNLDAETVEVSVQDTGTGMTPEVLARAMEPFYTTKPVGKGTGLGLAIVYRTVKAHQGRVELQSAPGKGTTVRLRFPVCHPAPPAPPAPAESGGDLAGLRVLLVDDDELVRSASETVLEALGCQASVAGSGEQALEMLAAGLEPQAVILDMNMPGLGGAGTLPRLRALRPGLPVILATGRTDQTALDLVEEHARVSLLAKPFSKRELRAKLEILDRI